MYFSYQGVGNNQNDPYAEGQNGVRVTNQEALASFINFLSTYQASYDADKNETYYYRSELFKQKNRLAVDLVHVKTINEIVGQQLEERPAELLPLFEQAAKEVLLDCYSKNEEGSAQEVDDVQIELYSSEPLGATQTCSIRELASDRVSKLVMVTGIVTAASRPRHKATYLTIQCKDCKGTMCIPCRPGLGGALIPRVCNLSQALPGSEKCSLDPFVVMPDRSKYVDQQTLKLQEKPEDVPTGEMPRTVLLVADRHLTNKFSPGTRVKVMGIYSTFKGKAMEKGAASIAALQQPYLRVVSMIEESGDNHSCFNFTQSEICEFESFARQEKVHEEIFARIAPNIFGSEKIKKAVACLLFGGSRKVMPDGTARRGDINVLMLGDPSTAKSQFLKFAAKVAPISVYTSGKGSSAAGLTATVVQDASTREFYLEGGAMVLADNGVVCIDEFDKMRPEDRVAIHEAMEQQTISIAKAGITTMLKSRTSVLAAANPPSGRYDDLKSAHDNIDLQSTILSRFDLIYIVKDEQIASRDKDIALHVLKVHREANRQNNDTGEEREKVEFLKRYIHYCRTQCHPRISESAMDTLSAAYVRMRTEARAASSAWESNVPPVPITVRQLEACIRISESLARMALQPVVDGTHVRWALDMFTESTLDAMKSGLTENVGATEEQREQIHRVENRIRQRLHIGATMLTRRLMDELVALGESESMVMRALLIMAQLQQVTLKRERSVVTRTA